MANGFDAIILGCGAMGSAAAYHLAKRGMRVLGLDRYKPPHTFGSSHGQTRIIREAYFEHPIYVPLIRRAYELWGELEAASGVRLLEKTGGLMVGPADGVLVQGARRSADEHRLPYELLPAAEIARRFPVFKPGEGMVGVLEQRAGVLFPELCVEAHLRLATGLGAVFRFNEGVRSWRVEGKRARVTTANGEYAAARLLLSAGGWMSELTRDLKLPLRVERQVMFWFEPRSNAEAFRPGACPIHIWEFERDRFFYGFPEFGNGVKIALYHGGVVTTPDDVSREVPTDEVDAMRHLLRRFLPEADGRFKEAMVCTFTNTPDGHFLIDRHPAHPEVVIASPCSGHGFKFSSVIGEVLADLLMDKEPLFELRFFRNRCW